MEDPLAQEFVSWRGECEPTIRSTYQILSRGTPNLENETWNASANVIKGTETPKMPVHACRKVSQAGTSLSSKIEMRLRRHPRRRRGHKLPRWAT
jgi:hypothetical protein